MYTKRCKTQLERSKSKKQQSKEFQGTHVGGSVERKFNLTSPKEKGENNRKGKKNTVNFCCLLTFCIFYHFCNTNFLLLFHQ